jgi:hypothetical protein
MIRLSSLPSWQGQAKKAQLRNLSHGKESQDLFAAGVFRLEPSKAGTRAIPRLCKNDSSRPERHSARRSTAKWFFMAAFG